MKVLVVHNLYREPGGEDTAVRSDIDLLKASGHDVDEWMVHNKDVQTSRPLRLAFNTVWNTQSRQEAGDRVRSGRYDVVHVHNTLPLLSPSIFGGFRDAGAAVVHSLHNYRMACPAGTLYRDGHVCTDCLGTRLRTPAVLHGCYRDSRPASAAVATMLAAQDARGTWMKDVDAFIAVSAFVRRTLALSGLPEEQIHIRPNTLAGASPEGSGNGGHVLFAGRLVEEKGILDVLHAWTRMPEDVQLVVAGDGPLRPDVERAASRFPNVDYSGQLDRTTLLDTMGSAALTVVPSRWHEPFGLVAIESLATGTPVLIRNVGGLGELLTGTPGTSALPDPADGLEGFIRTITHALSRPHNRASIRDHALKTWAPADSLDHLMRIYEIACERRRAS